MDTNKPEFNSEFKNNDKKRTVRLGFMVAVLLLVAVVIAGILGRGIKFSNPFPASKEITEQKNETSQVVVEEESATIDAVKKVAPAVVSIVISKDLSKYYNLRTSPYDFFSETPYDVPKSNGGEQEIGGGTGFIISADGLILTNKHVVSDEEAEYTVITNDGKKYEAHVLATDFANDIAIVKIDAKDLTVVELGDSDSLKLGQTVIAIGNSLAEYRNTITKGVISGIGRRVEAGDSQGMSEVLEEAIQTDAAINPGNSGGPLLNLAGQVIGINTAINQQGQLIGFAIPINQAKQSIESVRKYGKIVRPFLGVRYILLNEEIAKENNLDIKYGALIVRGQKQTELAIVPGSPADKSGLVENDIILEVNGQKIDADHQLSKIIAKYKPGDELELKVWHKGYEKKVKIKLEEYKN